MSGRIDEAVTHHGSLRGEVELRRLADRSAGLMDELPEAATVRPLHPGDLAGSRQVADFMRNC